MPYALQSFICYKIDDTIAKDVSNDKLMEIGLLYGDILAYRKSFSPQTPVLSYEKKAEELKKKIRRTHTMVKENKSVKVLPTIKIVFGLKCKEKNGTYTAKRNVSYSRDCSRSETYTDLHQSCRAYYGVGDNICTRLGFYDGRDLPKFNCLQELIDIEMAKRKKPLSLYLFYPKSYGHLEWKKLLAKSKQRERIVIEDEDFESNQKQPTSSAIEEVFQKDLEQPENSMMEEDGSTGNSLNNISFQTLIPSSVDEVDALETISTDIAHERPSRNIVKPARYRHSIGSPSLLSGLANKNNDVICNEKNPSLPGPSNSKSYSVCCPICGERKPVSEIEEHGSRCAEMSFPDIEEEMINESDEDILLESPFQKISNDRNDIAPEDLLNKIKNIIETCRVSSEKIFSLKIRRAHMFNDFVDWFQKKWFRNKVGCKLKISFHGESGIDQGGLRREFFSVALEDMVKQLFIKGKFGMEPSPNMFEDVAKGTYKLAGELLASSICMGGPSVNDFSPWIYDFISGGIEQVLKNLPEELDADDNFGTVYNKLKEANSDADVQILFMTDHGLDVLDNINFRGVPMKASLKSRSTVLGSIFLMKKVHPTLSQLNQLIDGLSLYGLLEKIKEYPVEMKSLFCTNNLFQWTFEKFEQILLPVYSPEGSSMKVTEVDVFKSFIDGIERLFYDGGNDDVSLSEIMRFCTGAPTLPPLGLPNANLKVYFKHGCENTKWQCQCKPNVSTCALSITLPTHYNTVEKMVNAITDAVRMSRGFDL